MDLIKNSSNQNNQFDESFNQSPQFNYGNPNLNLYQLSLNNANKQQTTSQNTNDIELKNNNLQLKVTNINLVAENKILKEKIQEMLSIINKFDYEKNENFANSKEVNNLKQKIVNLQEEKENHENIIYVFIILYQGFKI